MKKITSIDQIKVTENTLVVMFGVPASGKSYVAEELAEKFDAYIASSDAIREEIYGTAECQDDPNRVFSILQQRVTEELKAGGTAIIDATSLIKKYRVSNLKTYKGKFKKAILVVCATEIDIIKRQNQQRDRHVPEDVIMRMFKTMSFPRDEEGWDEIYILPHPENSKSLEDYLNDCKGVEHDNPHHKLGIYEHMLACEEYLQLKDKAANKEPSEFLYKVARYHDIGKPIVKSRMKRKGKEWVEDSCSHYIGHADVGSYMAACSPDPLANELMITLIGAHMDRFASPETYMIDFAEAHDRDLGLVGAFMALNDADEHCNARIVESNNKTELLKLLHSLDLDQIRESDDEEAEYPTHLHIESDEVYERFNQLCCDLFIDEEFGEPKRDAIEEIEGIIYPEFGMEIIAGDEDALGWLTGCIVMNDRETLVMCFG